MAGRDSRTQPIASGALNLLFVAPAFLLFSLFVLLPLISSVFYAFTSWSGFGAAEWVGLANFRRALADPVDPARRSGRPSMVGTRSDVVGDQDAPVLPPGVRGG